MRNINQESLKILHAHGQQFLKSFSGNVLVSHERKRKRSEGLPQTSNKSAKYEEVWPGIGGHQPEVDIPSLPEHNEDIAHNDDEPSVETAFCPPDVVVFSDTSSKTTSYPPSNKEQIKAFMSSKTSRLRQKIEDPPEATESNVDSHERTNVDNDAQLHQLVHTKLLSGSLNPQLNLTPAHRQKALAGRLLELSGRARLGQGERSVRKMERNKAAKRVREGLVDKEKERGKQQLEQAKSLGNYHPTIKNLFESSSNSTLTTQKRDKGLTMGVGRFSKGTLKLRRDDIDAVQGDTRHRSEQEGSLRGGERHRARRWRHPRKRTK